ncbi:uncharacterized protein PFL1_06648 [Pseudozyma flocculosa PF-1]|nr:uncharacterized protein PFL1_06648 [Pseudozyma flocculosa PF-1]EPQ25781.1 hypothetical protein PFL1_06648 [Pseudozyma flocculosa PF-1]
MQYSEGLGPGPSRNEVEYWRSFVDEFFVPSGIFRLLLWNPASREQKGFEVPTSVLPRYFYTSSVSGVRSSQLSLDNPREYTTGYPATSLLPPPPASTKFLSSFPSPLVTHLVEASRATMYTSFENGWQVQMVGLLRAHFVPYAKPVGPLPGHENGAMPAARYDVQLRLESLDFTVHAHTGYITRAAIQKTKIETAIPSDVVQHIVSRAAASSSTGSDAGTTSPSNNTGGGAAAKGKKGGAGAKDRKEEERERGDKLGEAKADGGSKKDDDRDPAANVKSEDDRNLGGDDEPKAAAHTPFTMAVEQHTLPEYPVNEYGICLRAMRCLEITESVCQLRDLIDVSFKDKMGPIDTLRRFAAQYREAQQNRAQQNGVQPNGASAVGGHGQPGSPATGMAGQPLRPTSAQSQGPGAGAGAGPPPPGQQGQLLPSTDGNPNGTSPSGAAVSQGPAGVKRKNKTAPSPSPKLGHAASPAKRQR